MPLLTHSLVIAAATALLYASLGLAVARRIVAEPVLAWAMAPALGWALFNAAAHPLFLLVGFTPPWIGLVAALTLLLALADLVRHPPAIPPRAGLLGLAVVLAAALALAPAIALVPKSVGSAVLLTEPLYDHAKVAMIDEMARHGVPPVNPFFGEAGAPAGLAYYYLWHASAALAPALLGASGWEADIATTWFTAWASLLLMMGLAAWLAGRAAAALWVLPLALAASLRPLLMALFGKGALRHFLATADPLQPWLLQATWVPQHLASASSVLIATLMIARLDERGVTLRVPVLALLVAAGFESSTWIGGITFAAASLPLGLAALRATPPGGRRPLLRRAVVAAVLAVALAWPFIHDEFLATAARAGGLPIAFSPYAVLGDAVPEAWRRILDLPAYWLLLLPIECPAIYVAGIVAARRLIGMHQRASPERDAAIALALLAATGAAITWLLESVILNNDLGWRAVLPAAMVLTVFAAAGWARWIAARRRPALALAGLLLLSGLPAGVQFVRDNAAGLPAPSAQRFAEAPALWAAVRRHAAPDERVADNPRFLGDLTRWPVNISWALLAERRSCYASWDLVRPYVALPAAEVDRLEQLFERIFDGTASPDEVHLLARRYDCRVLALTPSDGAWTHDIIAASPDYRLVEEEPGKWRIYRAVEVPH